MLLQDITDQPRGLSRSGATIVGGSDDVPVLLGRAETAVVRAVRRYAKGRCGWNAARRTLWLACGEGHIEPVWRGFETFLPFLLRHAREPVVFYEPPAHRVTAHELDLLTAVAAGMTSEDGRVCGFVTRMVEEGARNSLATRARALALALSLSGLRLQAGVPVSPGAVRLDRGVA